MAGFRPFGATPPSSSTNTGRCRCGKSVLVGKATFRSFDYRHERLGNSNSSTTLLRHIAHRRRADRLTGWNRVIVAGAGAAKPVPPPSRPDVIAALDHRGSVAAITFIFSRGLRRRRQTVPSAVRWD